MCEDQIKIREKLANERKSETLERTKKKSETLKRKMRENETLESKQLYLVREREVRRVLCTRHPLYLLFCQNHILNANQFGKFELPSSIDSLLQNYKDVFPASVPDGLPPLRGIEHHINLITGDSLPYRPAYWSNPQETKEIEKQVTELMSKGWVRDNMSPLPLIIVVVNHYLHITIVVTLF